MGWLELELELELGLELGLERCHLPLKCRLHLNMFLFFIILR
jgi:hypothetical protein